MKSVRAVGQVYLYLAMARRRTHPLSIDFRGTNCGIAGTRTFISRIFSSGIRRNWMQWAGLYVPGDGKAVRGRRREGLLALSPFTFVVLIVGSLVPGYLITRCAAPEFFVIGFVGQVYMYLAMAKRYAADAEKEYLLAGASDRHHALFYLRQVALRTMRSGSEVGSYLRRIDVCITQL